MNWNKVQYFVNCSKVNFMNQIDQFIRNHNVQPGSIIKAKSRGLVPIFDHYCFYLGKMYLFENGHYVYQNVFAANFPPYKQLFGERKAHQFLADYVPVEIIPCHGVEKQKEVIRRVLQLVKVPNERYDLLFNNCQDFVSEVTTGRKGSYQRDNVMIGLGLTAIALLAIGSIRE